jgi:hypothetical protein
VTPHDLLFQAVLLDKGIQKLDYLAFLLLLQPFNLFQSEPQTAQASTCTRISSAPQAGMGTASQRTSSGP